jgi:hypothetical protein
MDLQKNADIDAVFLCQAPDVAGLTHKLEKKKKFYGLRGFNSQFLLSKRNEKNAPCDQCNLF